MGVVHHFRRVHHLLLPYQVVNINILVKYGLKMWLYAKQRFPFAKYLISYQQNVQKGRIIGLMYVIYKG